MTRSAEEPSLNTIRNPLYAFRNVCKAVRLTSDFSGSVRISLSSAQPFSKTTLTRTGLEVHETKDNRTSQMTTIRLRSVTDVEPGTGRRGSPLSTIADSVDTSYRAGCLNLSPNPPPDFVGFGDDHVLVHREDLATAHDELAVDHDGLDVGRLTIVDPRGHDAPRRYEVGSLRVQDKEVCLLP